jgi:multiple sugar transport system substrate-binding protein
MQRIQRDRLLDASTLAAGGGSPGSSPLLGTGSNLCSEYALHGLKFVDCVPVSNQLLKGKPKDDCQKLGVSVTIETINGAGTRILGDIGQDWPDIIWRLATRALYTESLIEVSDIADEVGKAQGGYFSTTCAVANDGTWIATPFSVLRLGLTPSVSGGLTNGVRFVGF